MAKKILLYLSSLMLCGCSFYKEFEKPEVETQHIFGRNIEPQYLEDSTSMASLSWKDVFTDVYLQRLISHVLSNNADMKIANLNIDKAEAYLKTARLDYLPTASFNPQCQITKSLWNDNSSTSKHFSMPVQANWEIETFGKITNNKRKASIDASLALDYAQATRARLIAATASLYYRLLMLDAQAVIALETKEGWDKTVETMKALKEAGMTNEAGVAQNEANAIGISMTILDLDRQINEVQNSLCILLSRPLGTIVRGQLDDQVFPESFSVGVPAKLLENRPDIREAEKNLAKTYYDVKIAKASLFPSLSLSGMAGWTNNYGGIPNPGGFIAQAFAGVSQPIFAHKRLKYNYKNAQKEQEIALIQYQQKILEAGNEVNKAILKYQTVKAKTELYENQVAALERAAMSTELLMKHGSTTYLEVITAQQSLLNANLSRVTNKFEEIQSIIEVYTALGGGCY